ncbi:TKL protein kinase [Saprolegnia diclina VS20]|uniref:TKL protein kinase n=1 Tax=Saprolegnia diclina (strain VS20) TaxID=1156394 RepID=T0PZX0_SAPDV|nr:TKL protein kinase [Saprolegnia diclina VS20]EQC26650.1 TKL protein kinase [Saprolegnia diclina VS20]|eukprot:XP_008619988.1 TKL protein kinase [Saprolegnia diclina VS20]
MVLEWMDRGDLKNVLEKTKPTVAGGVSATFPWQEKFQTMLAIADGLVYLHSLDVIHRDLKSRNVLMDSQKGTKLTDFGASREVTTETMTIGVGTYRWMAPEILQDNHYTTAADIYSFGMFNIPSWPVALLLGADWLMDMARTFTNVLGNCLASVVMAKLEGEFRKDGWEKNLASEGDDESEASAAKDHVKVLEDGLH